MQTMDLPGTAFGPVVGPSHVVTLAVALFAAALATTTNGSADVAEAEGFALPLGVELHAARTSRIAIPVATDRDRRSGAYWRLIGDEVFKHGVDIITRTE